MAGREVVDHGVYQLEWTDYPPGFLLSSIGNYIKRVPRSTRRDLRADAKRAGLSVAYELDLRTKDERVIPLALFASGKRTMEPSRLLERAGRLASKFFPGVVTIVPFETVER